MIPKRDTAARDAWRKRREERREKQRAVNGLRAKKMGAARKASQAVAPVTSKPAEVSDRDINVGCSGWFYWHWRGIFYPTELPTSQWFAFYQKSFRTVELNAPFYSWPTVATVNTWKRQATKRGFRYAVKANELITHRKMFVGTTGLVRDFGHVADILGEAFGCFLFQLPPSYHFTEARLRRILRQLEPHRRNVVEFRHRSWWTEPVFRAFRDHGVTFCSCSAPRLPDGLIETADCVYIRFHGKSRWYRHDYTAAELESWARQIEAAQAKDVWVYFNNDREGFAIKNARALMRRLKAGPRGR